MNCLKSFGKFVLILFCSVLLNGHFIKRKDRYSNSKNENEDDIKKGLESMKKIVNDISEKYNDDEEIKYLIEGVNRSVEQIEQRLNNKIK